MSVNSQEILDGSTCQQSLQVADIEVGMIVPAELGPSLVLSIEERKWRFSENPSRRFVFRLVGTDHVYTSLLSPGWVLRTPADWAFRRWMEKVGEQRGGVQ